MWALETINIRDFGIGRHRAVDDTPAGGGAGMVLRADVLGSAIDAASIRNPEAPRIYLSPRGELLTQAIVRELAAAPGVLLLAGRFEGIDERVIAGRGLREISIGDYVLAGGEVAALVLHGGNRAPASRRRRQRRRRSSEESFEVGLLEYPQYTRPREWEGASIPDVLLSGDHKKIAEWRRIEAERMTAERRPDLWGARAGKSK